MYFRSLDLIWIEDEYLKQTRIVEKYLELIRSVVLDLEWIGGRRSPGSCHCSGNSHIWSNPPPHKYQGQNFYDGYNQDEEEQKILKTNVDVRLFSNSLERALYKP